LEKPGVAVHGAGDMIAGRVAADTPRERAPRIIAQIIKNDDELARSCSD
jgi:hypothetical protein